MIYKLRDINPKRAACIITVSIMLSISACKTVSKQSAEKSDPGFLYQLTLPTNIASQNSVSARVEAMHYIILGELAWDKNQIEDSLSYYLHALKLYPDAETAARATELALVSNQFESALFASTQWAELDKQSEHAQAVVITLYTKSGNPSKAQSYMENLYQIDKERFVQALVLINSQMKSKQEKEQVYKLSKDFHETHQNDVSSQFVYALAASRAHHTDIALKISEQVVAKKPQWTQATALYVKLLTQKQEYDKATQFLRKNLQLHPENDQIRLIYGKLLLKSKKYDAAKAVYESLSDNPMYRNDALVQLAVIALEVNDKNTATDHLLKLLEHDPANSAAYFYLGLLSEQDGNAEQAMQFYEKVGLSNYFYSSQTNLAILMARNGQLSEALTRMHGLMMSFPSKQRDLTITSVYMLLEANESESAHELLTQALIDAPEDTELLYTRGVVSAFTKNVASSEKDLSKVIKLQPNHSNALNVLGYLLADQTNRLTEAHGYIKRALSISPNNPTFLDSMGWVLYRLERYNESLQHLEKAYQLDPDPEIAAHLGEVLWVSGKKNKAKLIFENALKIDEQNEIVLDVMKRFNLLK